MSIEASFKGVFGEPDICFLNVVVMSCYRGLVYDPTGKAVAVKWTLPVSLTITIIMIIADVTNVGIRFVDHTFVMRCYSLLYIRHTAIAEFHSVPIYIYIQHKFT